MSEPVAGHREIDHTADLGFEVWAPDLPTLHAASVRALAELCYERAAVEPREERFLSVSGETREERLVAWLQEVYFLLESEHWLTEDVATIRVCGDKIEGRVRGEPLAPDRHTLYTEIKAITYHDMHVELVGGKWRTTVIVDV
jgi:SHS2 domain-containing protein